MNQIFDYRKENNTAIGKKLNIRVSLSQVGNQKLYFIIDSAFKKFESNSL